MALQNNDVNNFLCEIQTIGNAYAHLNVSNLTPEEFHQELGILVHSLKKEHILRKFHYLPDDWEEAAGRVLVILEDRVREMIRSSLVKENQFLSDPLAHNYCLTMMITAEILWKAPGTRRLVEELSADENNLHWNEVKNILISISQGNL